MKVLTLSALCNTRIVLFRLPRVLTAMERSSAEVCIHQPDSLLFTGPPGTGVSWGYWLRENLITCWINILLPCFTQPNCLQVSLARAKACSGGPRPHSLVPDPSDYVLSDTLLSGLAAWAGSLACIGLGPLQALSFSLCFPLPLLLSLSIPLSVLPMNVSISLPMCKLFSPALRADGEQCLCRDFLCMSFLISQRVTRFPCSLLENGELARACIHTLHTCTNMHSQSAINMHAVLWGYWHSGSGDRVHYMSSLF